MRLRDVSPWTIFTAALVLAVIVAFAFATYLTLWGGKNVSDAFEYQADVVAAQRDGEVLAVQQFDRRGVSPELLRGYEKLLDADLSKIDAIAENPSERAPALRLPVATRSDLDRLAAQLRTLETLGRQRFQAAASSNVRTRNVSNALFAIVALAFTMLQYRLRRRLERGKHLVDFLQTAFQPGNPHLNGFDIGHVLISTTEGEQQIGGDTFDVYDLDGRYGSFMVADVSGKGLPAAVDTAFIKYSIRTLLGQHNAWTFGAPDPGEVLTSFAPIYERNAASGDTFVVIFLGVVDTRTGEVRYASAGHEPAWARIDGEVRILPPTGPLIGGIPKAIVASRTLQLKAGDALIVSTDGLTESRDKRGRMLDVDGVQRWLEEIDDPAQATANAIERRLRRRSPWVDDDLALLVVRYDPMTPRLAAPAEPALTGGAASPQT